MLTLQLPKTREEILVWVLEQDDLDTACEEFTFNKMFEYTPQVQDREIYSEWFEYIKDTFPDLYREENHVVRSYGDVVHEGHRAVTVLNVFRVRIAGKLVREDINHNTKLEPVEQDL